MFALLPFGRLFFVVKAFSKFGEQGIELYFLFLEGRSWWVHVMATSNCKCGLRDTAKHRRRLVLTYFCKERTYI